MDEKKNILKKGLLETKSDFTSKVMTQIKSEDKALSNILSEHGTKETSLDFTANLMAKLDGKQPKPAYTPVISKRLWAGIAAAFIALVSLVIFTSETSASEKPSYSEGIKGATDNFKAFFSEGSTFTYVLLGVLVLSIALFIEQRTSSRSPE